MAEQSVMRNIKFTSFDFNKDGSITESFVLTHALDLMSPDSLIECFKRFLYILDIIPEVVEQIIDDIADSSVEEEETFLPIKKNNTIDIKKESSNKENVQKFIKQLTDDPKFAKKVFEMFLRDIDD